MFVPFSGWAHFSGEPHAHTFSWQSTQEVNRYFAHRRLNILVSPVHSYGTRLTWHPKKPNHCWRSPFWGGALLLVFFVLFKEGGWVAWFGCGWLTCAQGGFLGGAVVPHKAATHIRPRRNVSLPAVGCATGALRVPGAFRTSRLDASRPGRGCTGARRRTMR